jgi:hypothetical protein
MIWLIVTITTIIITSLVRIRLLRQIFEHSEKRTFIMTSIISIMSVMSITLLYYIKQTTQINDQIYVYIYTSIIFIIWILYFKRQRFNGRITQSIVWIWVALLWWVTGTYSIAALGEESFKWIYIKKFINWLLWQLILLGIVSGIVFGWTENLVYMVQYIINNSTTNKILSLIQQRWIVPLIIHIWSLCLSIIIWFSLKKWYSSFIARWIAILVWIWSHYLFNISQIYQFKIWSWIIIIWYLIIISYSLFRSDLLYNQKNS